MDGGRSGGWVGGRAGRIDGCHYSFRKKIAMLMIFRGCRYFSVIRNGESVSVFKSIAISVSILNNRPTSNTDSHLKEEEFECLILLCC